MYYYDENDVVVYTDLAKEIAERVIPLLPGKIFTISHGEGGIFYANTDWSLLEEIYPENGPTFHYVVDKVHLTGVATRLTISGKLPDIIEFARAHGILFDLRKNYKAIEAWQNYLKEAVRLVAVIEYQQLNVGRD